MMAAAAASQSLAVYVVGYSGHFSESYVGCGKSCLCRQFMYNEYSEEPCSTLLQAEFDGCVINQQHVLYWGQKEVTYTSEKDKDITISFEIFEHTKLYQDGTNIPYNGEKYEKQIHTPLKAFINKYSFKSREEILYPEDYSAKKFTYTTALQVAYLCVVDVAQSCPVFAKQLHVMDTLINSIKKSKHHCVILATKFDSYCKENYKKLESCASKLKVDVIQSCSKYNTNIDTAFKYLAVKSLQLKKKHITVSVLTHADCAVEKRKQKTIHNDQGNIDKLPHISMANQPHNSMLFSEGDYICPPDAVSPYVPDSDSDSFDGGGDESHGFQMNNATYGINRSYRFSLGKAENSLTVKKSLSFCGQDTLPTYPIPPSTATLPRSAGTLPHSSDTLPKLPQKSTTFVPEIGRSIYISKPTSTRASKPLPLLPFESPNNGEKHLSVKKKKLQRNSLPCETLPTNDEDYVNTNREGSLYKNVSDEDSDSYDRIKFGYSDEELEESPPPSPSGTENKAGVTNGDTQDLPCSASTTTASTAEQPASDVTDGIEEDMNGGLPLYSTTNDYSSSSDAYEKIDFLDSDIEDSSSLPPNAAPSQDPLIHQNGVDSQFPMDPQTTKCLSSHSEVCSMNGSLRQSLSSSSSAAPSAPELKKTLSAPNYQCNGTQSSNHTPVSVNGDSMKSKTTTNYSTLEKIEKRTSVNLSSQSNHNDDLYTNNGVTAQPIYCNVPVSKKPLQSQVSVSYIKMYKVKSSKPGDVDQLSDTESEVYAYDYIYHKNLMLRKSGKDCSGIPPRSIRRDSYTPPSTDYVNISTLQDYVNVEQHHTVSCPPRSCSADNSAAQKTDTKPVPKLRPNYRPLYPARDQPRAGYYLSSPRAKPS